MSELVSQQVEAGVVTLSLDSPRNRNALSTGLMDGLIEGIETAAQDPDVRAVVIGARGPVFCAGADLNEARGGAASGGRSRAPELLLTIMRCPMPILAHIDGHVRGGGMGLVAACDIAVASPRATFAYSEVRIGVVPAMALVPLSGTVGARPLGRYGLTGEVFDSQTALRLGLVTDAPDEEDFQTVWAGILDGLRLSSPSALAEMKRLIRPRTTLPLEDLMAAMEQVSGSMFDAADAQEGMAAFLEGRPPRWAITASGDRE